MKLVYTLIAVFLASTAVAQNWISDTVVMGTNYHNEVYYSLTNDQQGVAEIRNWDLAFAVHMFEVNVLANPVAGVFVYKTPYAVSDFNTFDTTGFNNWPQLFNPFNDWTEGTLYSARDTATALDYGWGTYSPITHIVTGTRVFLLKLDVNGNLAYKKFYVEQKGTNGNWTFRYANLDGTDDITRTVDVSQFPQRHFAYYHINTDQFLNREPVNSSWDLLFTRYYANLGGGMFYPATGVLLNTNTEAVKAAGVNVNTVDETDFDSLYSTNISTIGHDWKEFVNGQFVVEDSLVYFVKTAAGAIYKLRFTSFGGSANGTITFDKAVVFTSVIDANVSGVNVLSLFPNPASSEIRLVMDASHQGLVNATVYDLLGRAVTETKQQLNAGLNTIDLSIATLPNGIYNVTIATENGKITRRFVKQ